MRKLLVAGGVLVVAWLGACAYLFLWPPVDVPRTTDAVVVLAGDASHRVPRGLELVRRGVSSQLVLSTEPGRKWGRWRMLCRRAATTCLTAAPYSTRGEAEAVARLARRRGWRSLAIVTSRYHVSRARLLFRRCFPGLVVAVGAGYDRRWLPVVLPLETAKLVRGLVLDRHC